MTIRNFDQSISTIPTTSILTSNITNYRGFNERGRRRIQTTLNINMATVIFCDINVLKELKKSPYLVPNILDSIVLDKADKNLTNLKLFKLYVQEYLKSNPEVYKDGFTFAVKQLDPIPVGLPIAICVFVK